MRLHMSQVYVCTAQGCGAVREGKRLFECPVVLSCGWGAAEVTHGKSTASQPKGVDPPQPPHQPLGPTSWAPVQRESRTVSSYLSRIP